MQLITSGKGESMDKYCLVSRWGSCALSRSRVLRGEDLEIDTKKWYRERILKSTQKNGIAIHNSDAPATITSDTDVSRCCGLAELVVLIVSKYGCETLTLNVLKWAMGVYG